MEINYVLLVHKNPRQVKRLVESLYTENTNFYIHINRLVEDSPFRTELQHLDKVRFLDHHQRFDITWGDISIVEAVISLLQQVIKDRRSGYIVLLSGQDYPVKDNAYIENFLFRNYGTNYMTIFPMPFAGWGINGGMERLTYYKIDMSFESFDYLMMPSIFQDKFYRLKTLYDLRYMLYSGKGKVILKLLSKRKFPKHISPYGGHFWTALPVETVYQILSFLSERPDYLKFHRDTLLPDESFFPSILRFLFKSPEEDKLIQDSITFTDWVSHESPSPIIFTATDMDQLANLPEHLLFARKFDVEKDEKILDLIDERLLLKPKPEVI